MRITTMLAAGGLAAVSLTISTGAIAQTKVVEKTVIKPGEGTHTTITRTRERPGFHPIKHCYTTYRNHGHTKVKHCR